MKDFDFSFPIQNIRKPNLSWALEHLNESLLIISGYLNNLNQSV